MKLYNRPCFNIATPGHNFRSPATYIMTLLRHESAQAFSTVTQDRGSSVLSPCVTLTPAGEAVLRNLEELQGRYPQFRLQNPVVMPDHLHFILEVTAPLPVPLGTIILEYKAKCASDLGVMVVFADGFSERITLNEAAKEAFRYHITSNPMRYLIRDTMPHGFESQFILETAGFRCGLTGNIFLLSHPMKSAVRVSRDKSHMDDYDYRISLWNSIIAKEGVLVSPFLNPDERKFRDLGADSWTGLIVVVNFRFPLSTPQLAPLVARCDPRRLLIVSTEKFNTPPRELRYLEAQELNSIAAAIAALPAARLSLKRR